jgi:hypothetical protein
MHRYHDVSDLNARWDSMPIQGVGAGVLATGPLGSLGAVAANYPWMQYSKDTETLQELTNEALKVHGYCPIKVDGKLGASTCGAVKTMLELTGQSAWSSPPATCQGFTAPQKEPCTGASSPSQTGPSSSLTTLTMSGRDSGSTWLIVGGLVAVSAIGAALYFTRKGH